MSNRAKRHLGRHSPSPLSLVPPEAPPRSILRDVFESDGPGWYGVRSLAGCVGGIDALEQLGVEPLRPEPFDANAVPAAHRSLAVSIHHELQAGVAAFNEPFIWDRSVIDLPELPPPFDQEYQVIAQRLLVRLARADGRVLARSTPRRVAAAIAWVAYCGSQRRRPRKSPVTADGLWRSFGVSSCTTLAATLHGTLGLRPVDADDGWFELSSLWLPDARLLHSTART